MENELFTFYVLTHESHTRTDRYMTRADADREFRLIVDRHSKTPEAEYVAYYCPSVGGLVNSWRAA